MTVSTTGIPATGIIVAAFHHYDPQLADRIETGRIKLRLLPFPSLVASNLTIVSQDKPRRKLVHIASGIFRMSPSSILSGAPRLQSINLRGAIFYLYDKDAGSGSSAAFRSGAGTGAPAPAAMERIKIRDGSIVAVAREGGEQTLASGISAKIAFHPIRGERTVEASGTVAGYRVEVSSPAQPPSQGNAGALPLRVEIRRLAGGPAVANASLTLIRGSSAKLISAPAIAGTIGNDAFEASASIDLNGGQPAIAASAKFGSVKVELPDAEAPGAKNRPAKTPDSAKGSIGSLIGNDLIKLSLQLSADRFEISGSGPESPRIEFAPAAAQVSLAGRQLALEVLNAGAYGGSLSGKASAQNGEPAMADFKFRDISLAPLLADLHEGNAARGVLDLTGHIEAPDSHGIAGNLAGNLSMTVRDGSIGAPATVQVANSLYSLVSPQSLLDKEGQLPFSLIAGRASIERGILSADRISFEGPDFRAVGHGRANLKEQKLDFVFDPQVRVSGSAGDQSKAWEDAGVPVAIKGSFSAPEASIDTGSLLSGLDGPAQPQSKNPDSLTQQALRGVMDAVRSFFNDGMN